MPKRPISVLEKCKLRGSCKTAPKAPIIVTSSPSMIQVIPSAVITRQCHRLHGNRSMRAGMFVRNGRSVLAAAATIWLDASPQRVLGRIAFHFTPIARGRGSPDANIIPQIDPGHFGRSAICLLL